MSGLREALEQLLTEWSERSGGYDEYRELKALLAAHPAEPAPVASRERVAEALHNNDQAHSWRDERYCPNYACLYIYLPMTDALLAAGVFRDEVTS